VAQTVAQDFNVTMGCRHEAAEQSQQGGLASAIVTDDGNAFS
jgi:hypothetical protein